MSKINDKKRSEVLEPGLYALHFDLDDSLTIYWNQLTHDPMSSNFVRTHERGYFEGSGWDDLMFVPSRGF